MPAKNILEIKDDFDVFVFDIYGVIWDGKKVIAGFDEVMKILTQSGKRVVIMSNSTALSPVQETVYAGRGFLRGVHYERLVTSGDAAEDAFSRDVRKLKFYQFGRPSKVLFARSPYQELMSPEEADFVYAGVPQTQEGDYWKDYLTMEPFAEELGYLVSLGKPLICANPDCRAFENQYDEPVVRQGSVAELYEKLGGKVIYYGKPHRNIYDFVFEGNPTPRSRMLMVGDTLETDIKGGRDYGMRTALTQTGIAALKMREAGEDNLAAYAERQGIIPDFII